MPYEYDPQKDEAQREAIWRQDSTHASNWKNKYGNYTPKQVYDAIKKRVKKGKVNFPYYVPEGKYVDAIISPFESAANRKTSAYYLPYTPFTHSFVAVHNSLLKGNKDLSRTQYYPVYTQQPRAIGLMPHEIGHSAQSQGDPKVQAERDTVHVLMGLSTMDSNKDMGGKHSPPYYENEAETIGYGNEAMLLPMTQGRLDSLRTGKVFPNSRSVILREPSKLMTQNGREELYPVIQQEIRDRAARISDDYLSNVTNPGVIRGIYNLLRLTKGNAAERTTEMLNDALKKKAKRKKGGK